MNVKVTFKEKSEPDTRKVSDVPNLVFFTHKNFPGELFQRYFSSNTCSHNAFRWVNRGLITLPLCDTVTLADVKILVKQ